MNRPKKTNRIFAWCFLIIASLVVGLVIAALGLDDSTKNRVTAIWLALAAGSMALIEVLWMRKLSKQINNLNKILIEDRDPDRYIVALNALLEEERPLGLRPLRLINLGAAYCEKRDYKTAKDYFLQIKPSRLYGMNKWIYWANLTMAHFYLGENTDACSIMTKERDSFERLKKSGQWGDLLIILSSFEMIANGDTEKAKRYLKQQQPIWENPRNADDFVYLRTLLHAQQMQCVLRFVQGERTNLVGVFQSQDNAIAFLKSIPFLTVTTDDYGTTYLMRYQDLPDCLILTYNDWQYVLSRFSYSAQESAGDIEALLTDVCYLDNQPAENGTYVLGYTAVDAYSYENSQIFDIIEKREALYLAAKAYYETQARKIARDGLGSEDGEYVLVSAPGKPLEMHLSFLLDLQAIEAWEEAGSFENWLAQNQRI